MNISKEEFKSYVNRSLPSNQMQQIDQFLEEHPLERKALEGACVYQEEGSFDELVGEIDDLIDLSASQMNEFRTATEHSDNTPILSIARLSRWVLATAAVVLMFVLVRSQWTAKDININSYFNTYPDVVTNIVRGEESKLDDTTVGQAMKYYNEQDFEKALPIFVELNNQNPQNQNISFYMAIVEYALGNYASSFLKFELLSDKNARFQYDDGALWYKALCLIRLERRDEAKLLLTKISAESHYKKDEALDLLESL